MTEMPSVILSASEGSRSERLINGV